MTELLTLIAVVIILSLLSAIGVYRLLTANDRRKQRKQGNSHLKKESCRLPLKEKWIFD
jgi:hypothetical protein